MGIACCNSKSSIEMEMNDFWNSIKIREMDPSKVQESIKTKLKITGERLVATDFDNDFIEVYFSSEENKDKVKSFFRELYDKYSKSENASDLKYFFISMFFLTNTKFTAGAKRHFKDITKLFNFSLSENEKKVVTYKKELLFNITKFYVNLISLTTAQNFAPVAIKTNNQELINAFDMENQEEYINKLFKSFDGPSLTLDNYWSLYPVLSNGLGVRESLVELHLSTNKKKDKPSQ